MTATTSDTETQPKIKPKAAQLQKNQNRDRANLEGRYILVPGIRRDHDANLPVPVLIV